jgi:hypothetical protein
VAVAPVVTIVISGTRATRGRKELQKQPWPRLVAVVREAFEVGF